MKQTYIEALVAVRDHHATPEDPQHVIRMIHDRHAEIESMDDTAWLTITGPGRSVLRAVRI